VIGADALIRQHDELADAKRVHNIKRRPRWWMHLEDLKRRCSSASMSGATGRGR
jgi:hypothetical protein